MKVFAKTLFVAYLLVLLWLVLFKFSFDIGDVLLHYQTRSINVLPFWNPEGSIRETIDNITIFVPFGLLLSVIFKQLSWQRKLAYICAFSVTVEISQFVLAIGATDITDVVTNTLGGMAGLLLYNFAAKHMRTKKLDACIAIAGAAVLAVLLLWRILFLHIQY